VDVHMVFQVLGKGKFLTADITVKFTLGVMGDEMPPEAVFIGVCPVAAFECALECVLCMHCIAMCHYLDGGSVLRVSVFSHWELYRYNQRF
tara:strand:+ start:1054 stop:1326 length:273 start_codon:yes stop_codon:yes gene_type:complete